MYVCICKQVSDRHVLEAWEAGNKDFNSVSEATGLGSGCGSCVAYTMDILRDLSDSTPKIYEP